MMGARSEPGLESVLVVEYLNQRLLDILTKMPAIVPDVVERIEQRILLVTQVFVAVAEWRAPEVV